jgi:hypothetical protein
VFDSESGSSSAASDPAATVTQKSPSGRHPVPNKKSQSKTPPSGSDQHSGELFQNEPAKNMSKQDRITTQEISTEVLLEKYAEADEKSVQDVRRRVARGLAQAENRKHARNGSRPSLTRRRTASCLLAASIPPPD